MGWFARKVDLLIAAAFAGTAGAAVSQLQAFIQQYLQRLGGHLDEALRNYETSLIGVSDVKLLKLFPPLA